MSLIRFKRRRKIEAPHVTIERIEGGAILRVAFPRTDGISRVVERRIYEKDYLENAPAWRDLTMDMLIAHSLMEIAIKYIDVLQTGDKEGADGRPIDAETRRAR